MNWSFWRNRNRDLDREIRSHLESESREFQEDGLPAREASDAARRTFGNVTSTKESVRESWAGVSLERFLQDIHFSLRTFGKSPGFTLFAILTLALGLGANAAIFSVIDSVLLQPLPFKHLDRLAEVWEDDSRIGFPQDTPAPANYADWRARNHVFSDMAALKGDLYALTGGGTPEQVEGSPITANLFPMLGVSMALGRNIRPEEDQEGGRRVALISYGLWQRRFAADRGMIGRSILLNGQKYEVVGVVERGVTFPERSHIWVPLALSAREFANRSSHYLRVFARLKPGVTMAEARREMSGIALQLAHEYPDTNLKLGATVVNLRDELVGDNRLALWIVAAAVACVLLIACANLAGLQLARGAARERELAVRTALGASRPRLIRQILLENSVLGLGGGLLGSALALTALPFLRRLVPVSLASWSDPQLDSTTVLFIVGLSLVASLLFGTLPALVLSRVALATALQRGGRAFIGSNTSFRKGLIVAEVAIAVVLLVASGLLTKTLWDLSHVPLGFQPQAVLTMRTSLPQSSDSRYRNFTARRDFYSQVLSRIKSIPGVISAGYTTFLPLTNEGGTSGFLVEGAPPLPPGMVNDANHRVVSPDYFRAMGVQLRSGRLFQDLDRMDSQPVAIVNETVARQYWPRQNALGHRFKIDEPSAPWMTVVGVISDVRQTGLDRSGRAEVYFPYTQPAGSYGYFTPRDLAIRVAGEPLSYRKSVERAIGEVDRDQPIADVMPMTQLIDVKLATRDLTVKLVGAFAALSLLLAGLGLYGLVTYSVAQRRREIGVRMALGAKPAQVLHAFLGDGLRLVLYGLLIGAAGAYIATKGLASMLYGVKANDFLIFSGSAVVLLLIGAIASYAPAHRASRIDPMIALRHD